MQTTKVVFKNRQVSSIDSFVARSNTETVCVISDGGDTSLTATIPSENSMGKDNFIIIRSIDAFSTEAAATIEVKYRKVDNTETIIYKMPLNDQPFYRDMVLAPEKLSRVIITLTAVSGAGSYLNITYSLMP